MPQRLRAASDVRAALAARQRGHAAALSVHARRRGGEGAPRATVVAGRRVGTAPVRNRAKRRLRAALEISGVPLGCDVVVIARSGAATTDFLQLTQQLRTALQRAVNRVE